MFLAWKVCLDLATLDCGQLWKTGPWFKSICSAIEILKVLLFSLFKRRPVLYSIILYQTHLALLIKADIRLCIMKTFLHFLLYHSCQGRNQIFISGEQFSWTFIRLRHRAYSTVVKRFRKLSQICSFRNISENKSLLVLIRPVIRGAKPTLKHFFAPLEKCVGHTLKLLTVVYKFGPLPENSSPPLVS